MIQDVGSVILFKLFETDLRRSAENHFLKEIAANQSVIEYTLDLRPSPEYIINKGRPHGHRHWKTPQHKEYHQAHNLKKRCIKKHFKGNHDRFLRDDEFRTAMLEHDRDEEVCIKWDDLEDKDCSHHMTEAEYFHKQNWWITLDKSGKNWTIVRTIRLQGSVVYNEPFTPRIWRTTTQVDALLEVPGKAPIIEFFVHVVAMECMLVVFIIHRKSLNEDACKDLWYNGETRCVRSLDKTSDERLSRIYCSLFCCNWIVDSWRRSAATDGTCKDNTSKDPFPQCESLQNWQGIHAQVKSQ